jgi:hypothetical protein
MILFRSRHYIIESSHNTPLPIALDRIERKEGQQPCLVNVGWFRCYAHASEAMWHEVLAEYDREKTDGD